MIHYRFGSLDLGRVRFAIAPLYELQFSFEVLRDKGRQAAYLPWARFAEDALDGVDLSLLDAVIPERGYVPDFLAPPPEGPLPDIAGELDRVRAVPAEQVARELRVAFRGRRAPAAVRAVLADPAAGLAALTVLLGRYWELALAAHWPRVSALVEGEVAHQGRELAEGGPLGVFAELHPDIAWEEGGLHLTSAAEADVELGGRGLLLVPSAFASRPAATLDAPWQPTIIYPAPGAATLWEPSEGPGREALASLLGARRAEILLEVARPVTTLDLAARLGASRAGVNEHLQVLHRAGLVTRRRDGHAVRYRRTAAGDALTAAAAAG